MTIIDILAVLTVLAQIFILLYILPFKKKWMDMVRKNNLKIAFAVALTATLGSLYLSEIAHFTPCDLCWFQRIFMYPQVIILGIAILKKDKNVKRYVLPLNIAGIIVSAYHNYIQITNTTCSVGSVSCLTNYVFKFGYVTIPMMAFTAFLLIIVLLYKK